MLDVALLGTGGMMPLPNRFLTSLLARHEGRLLMIDCGEGTQITLKMLGWGFKQIEAICFTHFHADHISGLPGLLLTIGNAGRVEPLHLVGPPGLRHVVKSLMVIAPEMPFELVFHELPWTKMPEQRSFELGTFQIETYPLDHHMPCFAYKLKIKRQGKFDVGRAKSLNLPVTCWSALQKKGVVEYNGVQYTADMVLGAPRKPIQICYCTDSRPVVGLAGFIENSDLFICEGIYGEEDKQEQAARYKHMTFREAAELASSGAVRELWLTHYSPSLTNPTEFLGGARQIFQNTVAGYDRISKTVYFEN